MYPELYSYFIRYKNLHLPGIGGFILERKPAEADFINKCIHPPVFAVSMQTDAAKPSLKFYSWLAAALAISEKEAIVRFNDFVFDLKKQLNEGAKIEWKGIGTISKGLGESIRFVSEEMQSGLQPVPAEKIIREKAEHAVRVGEQERTSTEMTAYLSQAGTKRNNWWVLPLSAALLAFMYIGWHLSNNGVNTSALGNANRLSATTSGTTYKVLE